MPAKLEDCKPCNSCAKADGCPALDKLLAFTKSAFTTAIEVRDAGIRCDVSDLMIGHDGYVSSARISCLEYEPAKKERVHAPRRECGCAKRDRVIFALTDALAEARR
jgi:hypothetical protein